MKPIDQWDEGDLKGLIVNHAEETVNLEFKRAEALENMQIRAQAEKAKTAISKDVSSSANSAGGLIIYGIEESEQATHEAKAVSPVDPVKPAFRSERLLI